MDEYVVLVNENDKIIGKEDKIKAHKEGKKHRAFSIFIFDKKKRMLVQQRAFGKYHCQGLWTNSCCSHPKPNEKIELAVHRRLKEELGFDCELKQIGKKSYNLKLDNGLIENEIDYLFVGEYEGEIKASKEEVSDFKFISIEELKEELEKNKEKYTPWFRLLLQVVMEKMGI